VSDRPESEQAVPVTICPPGDPRVHPQPPDGGSLSAAPFLPPNPSPGRRYRIHGEIARGGMGAVLRGHDSHLGRDVAIKVLLEGNAGEGEYVRRFVEEAQIAGQLQHPGVVPVYEFGRFANDLPYFTMKLVKGQTLARLLAGRQDSRQDLPRFLKVFEQVGQTLAYAHSRAVIHRDLKPHNVMVGAFGEVQVMDWGLAKVLRSGDERKEPAPQGEGTVIRTARSGPPDPAADRGDQVAGEAQTTMGSVMGTASYVAPEQALGEVDRIDERCDVFGLGAILCEILSGKPPYVGPDIWHKARRGDLADAFARLDACEADAELVTLAKHCLAPEPEDRPRDGAAVAEAMTRYLESVSERLRQAELAQAAEQARRIEAQSTAEQERKAREAAQAQTVAEKRARRLTLSLAATLLLAALLGGSVWGWVRQQQEAVRLMEAKREALEDASIEDSRSTQTLMRVLQEQEQNPDAQHVVKKIQLVQTLGRVVFAESPKTLEAALENWKLLEANLKKSPWFPTFLREHDADLETITSDTTAVWEKRESLLRTSQGLRGAIAQFVEEPFLDPLRKAMLPHWRAQAQKAAERLAGAAEGGKRLDEVSFYANQFWRLRCCELVLVNQEQVEAAMAGFGRSLEQWEKSADGTAPEDVRRSIGAARDALRKAHS
jgi:serine/threonine protein kinase